jgi:hypothetical protein
MKTINIKTIRTDGLTQSRVEIDNTVVTEYAEAIKAGSEFPAVVVFNDGADNWLADGFHRFHAHNQAGKTSIVADVRQGSLRDAKLFSFGANGLHGQRPTNADKRKSVSEMLADPEWKAWSQEKIAKTCCVSIGFVSKMVHEALSLHGEEMRPSKRTVERNGKVYEQNTAKIGVQQHREAAKAKHESDIARGGDGSANAPQIAVAPLTLVEEYTELDAAHDQITELQSALAIANIGSTDSEEAQQAQTLIADLRKEVKVLRANLKAVTTSRDTLQNELAMVKRQCVSLQAKIKKAA